jgi:hypothetical protein
MGGPGIAPEAKSVDSGLGKFAGEKGYDEEKRDYIA